MVYNLFDCTYLYNGEVLQRRIIVQFITEIKIGLWNGWIPLCFFYLIFGIFIVFPKDVVRRLYDKSGWNKKQIALTIIGKLLGFACLIFIIFTPLKIDSIFLIIGTIFYTLGFVGFIVALFNYKNTSRIWTAVPALRD